MGDKEFNGDIEEGFKYWWKDYNGDIEEERREIIKHVNKIKNPEKREDLYDQLINALEYGEYFAHNRHFKCESSLINLRMYLEIHKDKNIEEFIDLILSYTNMKRAPWSCTQNILIVNGNRKFTFLNTTNLNTRAEFELEKFLEKGKTKLRREYEYQWMEGYDDDETEFTIVCVRLCEWGEDE